MIRFPNAVEPREKYYLAHALHLFNTLKEMAPIRTWLESEMQRLDQENRSEPAEDVFRQRQGALQTIENLLKQATEGGRLADDIQNRLIDRPG